jgi:hypothetical protein
MRKEVRARNALEKINPNIPDPNAAPEMIIVTRGSSTHSGAGSVPSATVPSLPPCKFSTLAIREGADVPGSDAETCVDEPPSPFAEEERVAEEAECRRSATAFPFFRPQEEKNPPPEEESGTEREEAVVCLR